MTNADLSSQNPVISILGCGWLGFPLARHLLTAGYRIKGSTTDTEKVRRLEAAGIDSFRIQCDPHISGDNLAAFFQSDILFLNIPFRRDLPDPAYYHQQISSVAEQVRASSISWVIFAGTTSVYSARGQEVTEDDVIVPENPRQTVLLEIENDLLKESAFDSTVIRFAGLYGGSRELGRFMGSSRGPRPGGTHRVNLIHLDDCVAVVRKIVESKLTGEILNAVSDGHPTRKDLYTRKARELGVEPPQFTDAAQDGPDKIVSNHKLKTLLPYQFIHSDPLN
ncbi:MAG: SDR family oxidoreductase [Candidatus Omnitrophica bacterium]|nr:SDR family oxidoreductase [Candidatus Omnitrophota bacterium]